MNYMIDAWLECTHPRLRVLDRDTGQEYLVLNEYQLITYREQGLDIASLYTADQDVIQEFTEELFAIRAAI